MFSWFQKVKGLMRKRSGAAARLQRALSTKSLRSESPPSQKTPLSTFEQRTFLMEAPVQFSTVSPIPTLCGVRNKIRQDKIQILPAISALFWDNIVMAVIKNEAHEWRLLSSGWYEILHPSPAWTLNFFSSTYFYLHNSYLL